MCTERRVIAHGMGMFTHCWTVFRIPPCALALQCYELARRKGVRRYAGAVLVATALLIAACATQTGGASVGGHDIRNRSGDTSDERHTYPNRHPKAIERIGADRPATRLSPLRGLRCHHGHNS